MSESELPSVGETVVVKVKRILDYGVFVELLEFDNKTGFVHISEIASRWVKNIRNHVKENQVRVAQVLAINQQKNQIDLSLTKVSSSTERARIDEWKKQKRAQKIVEIMAQKKNVAIEKAWEAVAEPLLEKYDSLYEAFQEISLKGKTAAAGVLGAWTDTVVETCQASIVAPEKTVMGELELSSLAPNGVEHVRESLKAAQSVSKQKAVILYEGAGKFSVRVTAPDFKTAEKDLQTVCERAVAVITSLGGKGKIERSQK